MLFCDSQHITRVLNNKNLKREMKKVVIFGTGAFAEVAYFYFKNDSQFEIVAFTENKEFMKKEIPSIKNLQKNFLMISSGKKF